MLLFTLLFLKKLFSYENYGTIKPEMFVPVGKKLRSKHIKCFSKCMKITPCHAHVFLRGTKGSKKVARRWKMTQGAGGLQQVYEDNTMSCTRVFEGHQRFKESRKEVKDDSRSGRPSASRTEVNILFTNPSARAGYDTRSVFKRSLTGLISEFSFS